MNDVMRVRRFLMSVDLTYRGQDYRLAEPYREQGGQVTYLSPTSMPMECSSCGKAILHGSPLVLASIYGMHPGCAIRSDFLIPVGRSTRTEPPPPAAKSSGGAG